MSHRSSQSTKVDPVLERDRKREELWGIHHESQRTYRVSLHEVAYIEQVIGFENGPGPFEMGDVTIFIAATFALRRLREVLDNREYIKVECVERCWLERSMHRQVFADLCVLNFRPGGLEGGKKDETTASDRRLSLMVPLLCKDDLQDIVERVLHYKKVKESSSRVLTLVSKKKETEQSAFIPEDIRRQVSRWEKPLATTEYEEKQARARARLLGYLKCIGQESFGE